MKKLNDKKLKEPEGTSRHRKDIFTFTQFHFYPFGELVARLPHYVVDNGINAIRFTNENSRWLRASRQTEEASMKIEGIAAVRGNFVENHSTSEINAV